MSASRDWKSCSWRSNANTERRFREVAGQFAETDKRIAMLVSAIGEFIRRADAPQN